MANVLPTTMKQRLIQGEFEASDTYKAALFVTAYAPTASTANYSTTNECTATNYTAGGVTLSGYSCTTSSTKAVLTWSNFSYTNITGAFNYVTIYDDTHANDAILGIWDVGSQNVTGTTVNINLPTADSTSGLFRLA